MVPYGINSWSDQPIYVIVHRVWRGAAAYNPVYDLDSFKYGPVYPYALAWLYKAAAGEPPLVRLRLISIAFGLATLVPLVFGLLALRQKAARQRPFWALPLAIAFTVAMFGVEFCRQIIGMSLHPDVLTFLFTMSAIALALWYPRVRQPTLALCLLVLASVLEAARRRRCARLPCLRARA